MTEQHPPPFVGVGTETGGSSTGDATGAFVTIVGTLGVGFAALIVISTTKYQEMIESVNEMRRIRNDK